MATLLGVPLYANSVSIIPVMEALIGKGVPTGHSFGAYEVDSDLVDSRGFDFEKGDKMTVIVGVFWDYDCGNYGDGMGVLG